MSSEYRIKPGHNYAYGDLVLLNPQPASPGVEYIRRVPSGNGAVFEESPFLWLYWNVAEDTTMYQSILNQCGLLDDLAAGDLIGAVTVWARDEMWNWKRYNGYAEQPRIGESAAWRDFFPQGIGILIKDLEPLEEP